MPLLFTFGGSYFTTWTLYTIGWLLCMENRPH